MVNVTGMFWEVLDLPEKVSFFDKKCVDQVSAAAGCA
jgi:hypothetical protein